MDILSTGFLDTEDGMYFELEVGFNDTGRTLRRMEIIAFKDGDIREFRATLHNSSSNMVWEFQNRRDVVNEDYCWIAERTSTDELSFEVSLTDSSITEYYEQNGDTLTIYFPTDSVELIRKTREQMLSREPDSLWGDPSDSVLTAAIVSELYRFDSFYVTNNTLHDNMDGDLVAGFLTDDDLSVFILEAYPDTVGGQPVLLIPEWVCRLAFRVAAGKCPFGGLGNAGCALAVGTVVACAVQKLVTEFF